LWQYEEGGYIHAIKHNNKYLNIQGKTDTEGRHIQANEAKNGQAYQQWDIVYVDEWKGEPGKGELNEEFGLYIERPFYIVSALTSHRYLELSTTDRWSSRLQMVETPKSGGSIKDP